MPANERFNEKDEFETAVKRYKVWPTTVWEVKDSGGSFADLKGWLGDAGAARSHSKASHSYKTSVGKNKAGATTSIFPPQVAVNILNLFIPADETRNIYDPFAGGGTRAVFAAKAGHSYTGVEIREEEVDNIHGILAHHGISDTTPKPGAKLVFEPGCVNIIHGDSRSRNGLPKYSFDFLITCPPYWTLEQYQGGEGDLSMVQDYEDFINEMWYVVAISKKLLKPGSLSCWVVGLHRKADGVDLAPMHHDITELHKQLGFTFREEIIIYRKNAMALRRAGNFERGNKLLIRQHEYCLVFESA